MLWEYRIPKDYVNIAKYLYAFASDCIPRYLEQVKNENKEINTTIKKTKTVLQGLMLLYAIYAKSQWHNSLYFVFYPHIREVSAHMSNMSVKNTEISNNFK